MLQNAYDADRSTLTIPKTSIRPMGADLTKQKGGRMGVLHLPQEVPEEVGDGSLVLSLATEQRFGPVIAKKTSECFVGPLWNHRSGYFDGGFSKIQPSTPECNISAITSARDWSMAEVVARILGVHKSVAEHRLRDMLIEQRHTITLAQAEALVVATHNHHRTGLTTSGTGNFAFAESYDSKKPLAVVIMSCCGRTWRVDYFPFGIHTLWRGSASIIVKDLDHWI